MAVEGGTVSHYYILAIRKFIDLCRFSDIVCGFLFLLNNFPFQSLEYATANSNSFKITQKTAFEAKGRLYTTGKVIQRLFIIDLYT